MERDRLISDARMALAKLQRSVPGTVQEGAAADDLVRYTSELMRMHHDAGPNTPAGEPVALTTDSWGV